MKRILTISLIVISFCIYSQNQTSKEWFSNIEIEYGENFEVNYNYALDDDKVIDELYNKNIFRKEHKLDNRNSFGLIYNINYPIFNKLTLGAIGGFQFQAQQKISALKLGGILRYHFVNYESININLMTAYNLALSKNIGSKMGNVRFGLQFPIVKMNDFNLNLNFFYDVNFYSYKGKYINEINENSGDLTFKSTGLSFGFLF